MRNHRCADPNSSKHALHSRKHVERHACCNVWRHWISQTKYSYMHQFNLFYRLLYGGTSTCSLAFILSCPQTSKPLFVTRHSYSKRKLIWSLRKRQPWGVLSRARAFSRLSVHFQHKSAHWFDSIYTLLLLENQIGNGIVTSVSKGIEKQSLGLDSGMRHCHCYRPD